MILLDIIVMEKDVEYILCAAIWYKEIPVLKEIPEILPKNIDKGIVVTGHRHGQCIWLVACLTGRRTVKTGADSVGETIQGFLTNTNRFVDRIEAAAIALKSGQIKKETSMLFSEDLY